MKFINESLVDRVVRIVIGFALLYLGWTGMVAGTLGEVFKYLGFVPLVTGAVGFCPLYSLFKFRTNKAS